MKPGTAKSVDALIDALVGDELDEAQMLRLCSQSRELVAVALLAAGKRVAEQDRRLSEQETVMPTCAQQGRSRSSPSLRPPLGFWRVVDEFEQVAGGDVQGAASFRRVPCAGMYNVAR